MKALAALGVVALVVAFAAACGDSGGSSNNNNNGNTTNDGGNNNSGNDAGSGLGYLIGGSILTAGANGLVLTTQGEPNAQIGVQSYPPAWSFANRVPTGTAYHVTIVSQPVTPQCGGICTCAVLDGGVGVVGTTDVSNILIGCAIMLP